jgi:hypothetical protein
MKYINDKSKCAKCIVHHRHESSSVEDTMDILQVTRIDTHSFIYTNFPNMNILKKRRSLGRHSSLADQGHGVFFLNMTENVLLIY